MSRQSAGGFGARFFLSITREHSGRDGAFDTVQATIPSRHDTDQCSFSSVPTATGIVPYALIEVSLGMTVADSTVRGSGRQLGKPDPFRADSDGFQIERGENFPYRYDQSVPGPGPPAEDGVFLQERRC